VGPRAQRHHGADCRDVVRLVKRSERHQRLEGGNHLVIDQHRLRIGQAAMYDAMTDAVKTGLTADIRGEPLMYRCDSACMVGACEPLIAVLATLCIDEFEPRRDSDALHLAMRAGRE
jgi:hypothetical protein